MDANISFLSCMEQELILNLGINEEELDSETNLQRDTIFGAVSDLQGNVAALFTPDNTGYNINMIQIRFLVS
ncbi:hypothetical protein QR680_017872 [Steinernema hermaphroditum]|uniref:Uncharacterized protein n=1 Tax=Steinernema hermaphroditum TaxID=289476 RepID=A0AA39HI78_9BILA|nr:hypothetical protein QR680_017872 [Steinernema hermaphroditum]